MDGPQTQNEQPRSYRAYLLRMWREPHDGRWRATLEDPNTADRRAFGGMPALIQFLQDITAEEGGVPETRAMDRGGKSE